MGITIQLKITSQAADFINYSYISSFLEYGGSPIVKTLNYASFCVWRMVRYEVEISTSVGGFSVNFGG
jgi:hypothetical protein